MRSYTLPSLFRAVSTLLVALAASHASLATTVNLTAQKMTATMPDGTAARMWGYCSDACSGTWAPGPTIVVNDGNLTINLTNKLPQPTSIVILGQIGGGLGAPNKTDLVLPHQPQTNTTFPAAGQADVPFTPPVQGQRVQSFGNEAAAATQSSNGTATLTWSNLRPGTYLYQTGTLPSLQAPMGLYGVVVVTAAPPAINASTGKFVPGTAYPGVTYDTDITALLSEIDPVHNAAVDSAATAGADLKKRFNDPSCSPASPCYPAVVNYSPRYYLINGKPYNPVSPADTQMLPKVYATSANAAACSAPELASSAAAGKQGTLLLRLVNAGLRAHTPAIVGGTLQIVAEDGNRYPGRPRAQSEVLMAAGKTIDAVLAVDTVAAQAACSGAIADPATPGAYDTALKPTSVPLFDRMLATSNAGQPGGGMQGLIQIAGGTANTGTGGPNTFALTARANDDRFSVPFDAAAPVVFTGNVRLNDIGVRNVAVVGSGIAGLTLNADGSFQYTPTARGLVTFTYTGNGGTTNTATVSLVVGNVSDTATTAAGAPVVTDDAFVSAFKTKFQVSRPGVLGNDSSPQGYELKVDVASVAGNTCTGLSLNPDGSFSVASGGATSCSFQYKAVNSQGVASASAATVNVQFGAAGSGSGLNVSVIDAKSSAAIGDYRWIIQEDLTFKHNPTGTPDLKTRTLATSFHRSHMPVVATGCVGAVSCGSGQAIRTGSTGTDANGTLGARKTVSDDEALLLQTLPSDVALDPTKHYFISILPGTAANPVVTGDNGHMMGGAAVPAGASSVTIALQQTPIQPAQLSIFIYEDNAPINGANDLNETGLGGFNIIINDAAGRSGDIAGQQTFDASGMPLTNALIGLPGCPDELNTNNRTIKGDDGQNLVGSIYTCPSDPNVGTPQADPVKYALAGHALVKNITPARYDVIARPGNARAAAGEVWWQVETLEGTPAQDAFTGVNEPKYFQEFGPPGFHTTIGFVNPNKVAAYAKANNITGAYTVTGKITNAHTSRPSQTIIYDSGSYDALNSTVCQVALNSQSGNGPAIAIARCDKDGNFTLPNVPADTYDLVIWDQWLDQIIQTQSVVVGGSPSAPTTVALGNIPVLSWFQQLDLNIFQDANKDGVYGDSEKGIANVPLTVRYRDGGISNLTLSDSNGNGILVELFPLFNWYVAEADTTRFKQSGVSIVVDGGGPVDTAGLGTGLWSSKYATGESSARTELPGAYSYGLQGFISQRNQINWGRTPYAAGENGGIQGLVVLSSTRPFDDQRLNVQTLWEPAVPRVTVNLYRKEKVDGVEKLILVDSTKTSSWDDYVNLVFGSDNKKYLLGSDNVLRDPDTGATAPAGVIAGKQVNMQCPGQLPGVTSTVPGDWDLSKNDPFVTYTLGADDQFRCYDGFHNWNQVQAAPYDGRYAFPSAKYVADHPLSAAQVAAGQTLVSLPPGEYIVETVTPPGYQVVKEEDKNIFLGDSFVAPVAQQFGALGSLFILPDQAALNNANPYNARTADGLMVNATSNLGVTNYGTAFPECVGNLHRVPDYLSLFPLAQQVAPFAGMDRPLCDRKLVKLGDQMQAGANFFVFTEVPLAANGSGMILNDASSEFNAAAPDFGEKAAVPFAPVSVKDFMGREIVRTYSDQWGIYNLMAPSSWLVNPPTPSGYGPNMLVSCMNDPGIKVAANGALTYDAQYNPAFSNFCYTLPFMPGRTTYLDTPVLPIAAFASGYNPADCEYPDATPAIGRVDSGAGFGPWLPTTGGTLTITAVGDKQVLNPAYAGPFAASGPASQRMITRHYGFGSNSTGKGRITIGDYVVPASAIQSWADGSIVLNLPAGIKSGQLVVTADNGKSSVDAVTVTLEDTPPTRVQGSQGQTIQAAIDAAKPGDLIMIDAGLYNELVIMWKPVRLQGVGASSVVINAAKYPTSKLAVWRPTINAMFAIDNVSGNQGPTPSQVDPLPTQEITGGVVFLEPSVLGSEEGAGITVLAKGFRADGVTPLTNSAADCNYGGDPTVSFALDNGANTVAKPNLSNFLCANARIDGIGVTGGDSGGGIYVNGWAHNLEISNNRVYGNAGSLNGGVRIGVPYLELDLYPGQTVDANGNTTPPPVIGGQIAGFGYDKSVKIHHNAITKNGTVEGPAGNGGAGAGISICTGSDGYSVDHNFVCGNYGSADGGGIGHLGFSQNGLISSNTIVFNQTFQQTSQTNGGGIVVMGEPAVGTTTLGTGNVTIDANIVRGNQAEVGNGGGIALVQVNGTEPRQARFKVSLTNNMVVNNVAGNSGGGVSIEAATNVSVINNTIAHNDSTGSAGAILGSLGAFTGIGKATPAGLVADSASKGATLVNNILWHNRSFKYDPVSLAGNVQKLCSVNDNSAACSAQLILKEQSVTGECVKLAGGADPAYWDLGILGASAVTPAANNKLNPTYSILSSASLIGAGGTQYAGAGNAAADPQFAEVYCNGSRIAPEYAAVLNPPSIKSIQVAATLDEGNNYVNVRFGPLSLTKLDGSTVFGDYHLGGAVTNSSGNVTGSTSAAYDTGTDTGAPKKDIDGDARPIGARTDKGADEFRILQPIMVLNPASLAFGPVSINTSKVLTVTVSNDPTAQQNLILGTPTVTAGTTGVGLSSQQGKYTLSNTCPVGGALPNGGLAPGASCTIAVTFAPTAVTGPIQTATLNVVPTDAATQSVALQGTGVIPVYSIAPGPLAGHDFGIQQVGIDSTPFQFTVTNVGPFGELWFTGAPVVSGGNGQFVAAFRTGDTCSATTKLAVGASCTFSVIFHPTGAGSRGTGVLNPGARVDIAHANGATNLGVLGTPVWGTGANPTASRTPTTLTFAAQQDGSTSASQAVTLTNTGQVPLLSPTFTITGTAAADFAVASNTCGTSVAVGANCTVNVTFKPTLTGTRNATLTLGYTGAGQNNAAAAPTVALTGTGTVSEALAPNPLTFTNVAAGTGAAGAVTKAVTLTNNDAAPVTITNTPNISAQSGGNGSFAYTAAGSTCTSGTVIPAGGTCTINVTYTPGGNGSGAATRTATLSVSVDGAAQTTALSATTVLPSLAPLDFGNVSRSGTAVTKQLTVTNNTSATVTLTATPSVSANNGASGSFTYNSGSTTCLNNATIQPGGTCLVGVTYTPQAGGNIGSRTAVVRVTANGNQTPATPSNLTVTVTSP